MGKRKRGFNETPEADIAINDRQQASTGDSNMLIVIPTKKVKVEKKKPEIKKLSKRERKRLEDVLARKEKKNRRTELLESLAKHQATEAEMKRFTSITEVYSQNYKDDQSADTGEGQAVNIIQGSRRKKKSVKKPAVEVADSTDTDDISTDEEMDDNTIDENDNDKVNDGFDVSQNKEQEIESSIVDKDASLKVADSEEKQPETVKQPSLPVTTNKQYRPVISQPLDRPEAIQTARLKLPILGEEQVIMEAIHENAVVILCGETGSGKTTQVPQFLYEAGYASGKGIIGITEPRRVAAISMSKRVAMETGLSETEVSYQIRYEGNVSKQTRIKFLTDGVLLKEIQQDPLLSKYSVVIIDEAHERSVYTDILIGLMTFIVRQRAKRDCPIKLIIMSATLRVEDFTNSRLFKGASVPPVIKVESRQYPVTVHFNKHTSENYVTEAYKKVCKIHRTLPGGGVLVFVTGQREVNTLVHKLRRMFPYTGSVDIDQQSSKKESRRKNRKKQEEKKKPEVNEPTPEVDLSSYPLQPEEEEEEEEIHRGSSAPDVDNASDDDEDEEDDDELRRKMDLDQPDPSIPLYVLPLYSLLSSEKQSKVFEPPPQGCRLCVVATNVAETSLTIPDVRYVVDTGKTKTRFYDKLTGISTFRVTWVSKASADQRAGRAGRTGPGHCYRLYSSAVFGDFSQFSEPEIARRPVEDLVLQMKSMCINKIESFPFPTPMDAEQIKAAESLLLALGALFKSSSSQRYKDTNKAKSPVITELGKTMATFPVSPRYSKMLVLARKYEVLPYVVALVSAMSVEQLFENPVVATDLLDKEKLKTKKSAFGVLYSDVGTEAYRLGDMMVLLKAVCGCESSDNPEVACRLLGVRVKAFRETRKLRSQLTNAVNAAFPEQNLVLDPRLARPNSKQTQLIRKVMLGGLADHVARRVPPPVTGADKSEVKKLKGAFECAQLEELSYVHPESCLFRDRQEQFLVYQSMIETNKLYMRGVCAIEPHWLPEMAPNYCTMSAVLEEPPPSYDVTTGQVFCHKSGSFGRCNWSLPPTAVPYPTCVDAFRWFAKFLLEGKVFPKLEQFVTSLSLPPYVMVRSWSKLQPKTESFLKALLAEKIMTRDSLREAWEQNPTYLRQEYMEWLHTDKRADLLSTWPPL